MKEICLPALLAAFTFAAVPLAAAEDAGTNEFIPSETLLLEAEFDQMPPEGQEVEALAEKATADFENLAAMPTSNALPVPVEPLNNPTSLIHCLAAVQVALPAYGGRITEQRENAFDADILWAPIVTGVERVAANPLPVAIPEKLPVHVAATWRESYVHWEPSTVQLLVELTVGLPYVDTGEGVLTEICDPEVRPKSTIQSSNCEGYDYCTIAPLTPPTDGWTLAVISTSAQPLTEGVCGNRPTDSSPPAAPQEVLMRLEEQIAKIPPVGALPCIEFISSEPPLAPQLPPMAPNGDSSLSTDVTSQSTPASTATSLPAWLLALILGALVVTVATVFLSLRRR